MRTAARPQTPRRAQAHTGSRIHPVRRTITAVSLFAVPLLTPWLARAEVPFTHVVVDEDNPAEPHCKTAADIDGDGLVDLLVASASGEGVWWYRAPCWSKHRIDEGAFTTDMDAADIDDDGDLDIVIPLAGRDSPVLWYENPLPGADPARGEWSRHEVGRPRGHHDVEPVDLDGDGRIDIVARGQRLFDRRAGDVLTVYRQRPDGGWAESTLDCPDGEGIAVADLNADGRPDLIISGRWYENPGGDLTGPWAEHVFTDQYAHVDAKVAAGDLNGDGRPDIIVAPAEGRAALAWFEAPADPAEPRWPMRLLAESAEFTHALAVADIDGDGRLDVIAAEMHQSEDPDEVAVHYNRDAARRWEKQVLADSGSHNLIAVDMDGDGDADIFGVNWSDRAPNSAIVEYWRNDRLSR